MLVVWSPELTVNNQNDTHNTAATRPRTTKTTIKAIHAVPMSTFDQNANIEILFVISGNAQVIYKACVDKKRKEEKSISYIANRVKMNHMLMINQNTEQPFLYESMIMTLLFKLILVLQILLSTFTFRMNLDQLYFLHLNSH